MFLLLSIFAYCDIQLILIVISSTLAYLQLSSERIIITKVEQLQLRNYYANFNQYVTTYGLVSIRTDNESMTHGSMGHMDHESR